MKTFAVLDRNQDIFGAKILEASAGTGKTFSVEHLFVRLLLEGKEMTIEQILVVTFTNAATRELKMRIRSNLQNALRILSAGSASSLKWDYLIPLLRDNEAIRKLEDALFCFDSAQIFTIHGFCYRMLSEFFIEAQFSAETQFLQGGAWEQKILIDFFHFGLKDYFPEQINILLRRYKTIEEILSQITKEKTDYEVPSIFNEIQKKIEEYPGEINFVQAVEQFQALSSEFKQAKFKDLEDQVTLCVSILQKRRCTKKEFGLLLQTKLSLGNFFRLENRKKKSEYDLKRLPLLFLWIQQQLFPLIQDALNPKLLLKQLAWDASSFLEKRMEAEKRITPDFLLKKMGKALAKQGFLHQVRKKYRAAIIDEFQDTDALQWQIFHSLFWHRLMDAFYLVGDPKQSIYRFRGADPQTYFRAKKLFGDHRIFHLNINYRSERTLVDSLNGLFSCNQDWFSLRKGVSHLPFAPTQAASQKGSSECCLQCLIVEGGRTDAKQNWPLLHMEEESFFPFIANEILRLVQNGFSFSNIAILLKDRFQLQRLKSFLEKEQIPCSGESPWNPAQSPVLDAMERLFHVLYNPRNISCIKALLGTLFFQYDLASLQALELDESYLSVFFFLRETLENEGLASFFQQFLNTRMPKRKTVFETVSSLKDLSFYEEMMAMIELFLQQGKDKGFQLPHFERILEQVRSFDPEKVKGYSDEDQIRILTIHKSKGLEFDIVFTPGLMQRTPEDNSEKALESDEEKLRYFYVALSRAKKKIYLFFAYDSAKSKIKKGSLSACELFLSQALHREDPYQPLDQKTFFSFFDALKERGILEYSFLRSQEIHHQKREENFSLIRPDKPVFHFPFSATYSFTSLARREETETEMEIADLSAKELPLGTRTGEILHLILQKALSSDRNLKDIIEEESCKTPLGDYKPGLYKLVCSALQMDLGSFSFSDVSKNEICVEMEFLSTFENTPHFLKGFIDVFFHHQGKYYLLDWKSNYLPQYDQPALEKEMIKQDYILQGSVYANAIRRYLDLFEKGSYEKKFGGMFYVFLRGLPTEGIYFLRPDLSLVEQRKTAWDL